MSFSPSVQKKYCIKHIDNTLLADSALVRSAANLSSSVYSIRSIHFRFGPEFVVASGQQQ